MYQSFLHGYPKSAPTKKIENLKKMTKIKYEYLLNIWLHTSKPTTFSTNNIWGGLVVCGISSRILRNEDARASPECFWRPNQKLLVFTIQHIYLQKRRVMWYSDSKGKIVNHLVEYKVDKEEKEAKHLHYTYLAQLQWGSECFPVKQT